MDISFTINLTDKQILELMALLAKIGEARQRRCHCRRQAGRKACSSGAGSASPSRPQRRAHRHR